MAPEILRPQQAADERHSHGMRPVLNAEFFHEPRHISLRGFCGHADGQRDLLVCQTMSDAEQRRRERAAAKLRENLARRKQQSRARRAGEAEDGVGLPAARPAAVETIADGEGGDPQSDYGNPAANSSKPGD